MADRAEEVLERMPAALDEVEGLVRSLARQGLQRLTRSAQDELGAAAQTAQTARMPRLERELAAIRTLAGRYLDRDPLFRAADIVDALHRVLLVVEQTRLRLAAGATLQRVEDWVGTPRRTYHDVQGDVDVAALCASGWVTDSGFVGITVTLAVLAAPPGAPIEVGRHLLASVPRPVMHFGSDPKRLLHQPISLEVTITVQELAHGSWRLRGARVSRDGRLSLHGGLFLRPLGATASVPLGAIRADRWATLVDSMSASIDPTGRTPRRLVAVVPESWGSLTVDDKRAVATLPVVDATGASLRVRVALRPENNAVVDNLAALAGTLRPDALVGRVAAVGGELVLEPISAIWDRELQLTVRRGLPVHELHLSLEDVTRLSER